MFRVPKTSVASFSRWRDRFGRLDIFVSNARPELPTFYEPPLTLSLDSWRMALDSQATAFLVGAQEASHLTRAGGRILAITYARMGTPADIGHAVALLCSEQAGLDHRPDDLRRWRRVTNGHHLST